MKSLLALIPILLLGMASLTMTAPDDEDDVKAAVLELLAAMNAADVEAVAKTKHSDFSVFLYDGTSLAEGFDKNTARAAMEAGLKFDWEIRRLDVKVYGNTAVVTGYNVGTVTLPDGTSLDGPRRFTEVWTKEEGQWMQVHRHASAMTGSID